MKAPADQGNLKKSPEKKIRETMFLRNLAQKFVTDNTHSHHQKSNRPSHFFEALLGFSV